VTAPLRLCVDATIAASGAVGINAYTFGLVEALARRDDVEVELLAPEPVPSEIGAVRVHAVPEGVAGVRSRVVWRERSVPRILRASRAGALLATSPELPFRPAGVPAAVVVHDVFPLAAPELTGRAKQLRFRALLPGVCRRADAIVCVSEATRADLERTVPAALGKTRVIGEGPTALPAVERRPAAEPWVLYVGELYRRKNLITLLEALREVPGLGLRLAGPARPETRAALERQARDWGLAGRVRHEGFVTPRRLAELQAEALALVLPSLAEGFGRPLLDAMAAGTPCVASDIPALRELSAGAALLAGATDVGAWAAALRRVRDDAGLRDELSARGRERAAAYAWERVAGEVAGLMTELAA
jgi:glycosyltransferase involved in cell wall biosynthesis